jgi:hypothetical protein
VRTGGVERVADLDAGRKACAVVSLPQRLPGLALFGPLQVLGVGVCHVL